MVTPSDLGLLLCEMERVRQAATAEGAFIDPTPASTMIDATLLRAVANTAAYVLTTWEVIAVRDLASYATFNATYDALQGFVDSPDANTLEHDLFLFAGFFGALASRRNIADQCAVAAGFEGLYPADPATIPANLATDPTGDVAVLPQPPMSLPTRVPPALFGGGILGIVAGTIVALLYTR